MKLENHIQKIAHEGLLFYDITPLLDNPEAVDFITGEFVNFARKFKPTAVLGIGGAGFIFASAVANRLKIPFHSIQKKPLTQVQGSYFAEIPQSGQALTLGENDLDKNDTVLIIDEALATGRTLRTACELVGSFKAQVAGFATILELTHLGARAGFSTPEILSLVKF